MSAKPRRRQPGQAELADSLVHDGDPQEVSLAENMGSSDMKRVLSISGGKDSTAMYLLALELGRDFTAVFADTGNEHEITYDYVRDLPRKTGGPEIRWGESRL